MPEPNTVTIARAGELLANEHTGGALIPLTARQVRDAVKRGDLERHGSGKTARITKRSIAAYLEGKRGIWQANGASPAPERSERSGRSTKPAIQKQAEGTTHGIVIPWRTRKPG